MAWRTAGGASPGALGIAALLQRSAHLSCSAAPGLFLCPRLSSSPTFLAARRPGFFHVLAFLPRRPLALRCLPFLLRGAQHLATILQLAAGAFLCLGRCLRGEFRRACALGRVGQGLQWLCDEGRATQGKSPGNGSEAKVAAFAARCSGEGWRLSPPMLRRAAFAACAWAKRPRPLWEGNLGPRRGRRLSPPMGRSGLRRLRLRERVRPRPPGCEAPAARRRLAPPGRLRRWATCAGGWGERDGWRQRRLALAAGARGAAGGGWRLGMGCWGRG